MNHEKSKYAVIGAGCGGHGVAGNLALLGYDVTLWNRPHNNKWDNKIKQIEDLGCITLIGQLKGKGNLSYVGTDISKALEDRDIIMVVTTATGHKDIAKEMAPYLKDGQIILLNPGRTFGALEVYNTLKQNGCNANVIVGEANTLMYAVRAPEPGVADIKGVKNEVSVSALRKDDTEYLIDKISSPYPKTPRFIAADSFIETSVGNIGAVFHPAIILGNKKSILEEKDFEFYTDGVTKKVAGIMEQVDYEIQQIANALGTKVPSVPQWMKSRYGLPLYDIHTMIQSNPAYKGIKAPKTLNHRYLLEDIPTGLVPIALLGDALDIHTPTIDSLINEGSTELGIDFRKKGRTLEKLGLSRKNVREELENIIKSKNVNNSEDLNAKTNETFRYCWIS